MSVFRCSEALLSLLLGVAPIPAFGQSKHPSSAETSPTLPVGLCFTKGAGIYVQAANQAIPEKWMDAAQAVDVRLSPDGDALAFTLDTTSYKPTGPVTRHIAVLEGKGARYYVLDSIPGSNSYGPVWSPDGKLIMFQQYTGNEWHVALVGRDGSGFRVVYSPPANSTMINNGCWSNDSKYFYCFDFEFLYRIDLSGRVASQLAFKDIPLEVSSSTCQFRLSPDGRQMLIETEIEVDDLKNDDYPSPVIFLLDLGSKKARRVSPKGMMLSDPEWLKDGKSFVCRKRDGKKLGIYRIDIESGNAQLIIPGGKEPSVSR